jgi:hypothetical protein
MRDPMARGAFRQVFFNPLNRKHVIRTQLSMSTQAFPDPHRGHLSSLPRPSDKSKPTPRPAWRAASVTPVARTVAGERE